MRSSRQHGLGRGGGGVAPQMHRRGAGVAGDALEGGFQPQLGGDAGHHPDRQLLGLEHRPLLDMGLDIGQDLAGPTRRLADLGRIQPETAQGLGQGDAPFVAELQLGRLDPLHDGAAAQHGGGEARALLVAEGDHLDGERQPLALGGQGLDRLDPQHDPQRPVIAAAVVHGVDVGADQQRRRARRQSLIPPYHIAYRVEPNAHLCGNHPAFDPFQGFPMRVGQVGPVKNMSVFAERRRAEGVTAGDRSTAEV